MNIPDKLLRVDYISPFKEKVVNNNETKIMSLILLHKNTL